MMSDIDYRKYAVSKPLYESDRPGVPEKTFTNRQIPPMTFISDRQIPGINYHVDVAWIRGMPELNPSVYEHAHDYDKVIIHWGANTDTPQDLGAEIEFYIGGQAVTFNTTTAVFIPKGLPHGPVTWKNFRFPHLQMTMTFGTGNTAAARGDSPGFPANKALPVKKDKFDYEQYVVRSPMREAGAGMKIKGRQYPTMTYMSKTQISQAPCYIEFGWIWDEVKPGIPEMIHKKYDEIVLHLGSDPEHPEDLGADLEMGINGHLMPFTTNCALFVPKGLLHGPNNFNKVRKPYIEMAIMIGAGTWLDGWQDSFIEKPVKPT